METFQFGHWQVTAAPECGGNLASLRWRDLQITRSFASPEEWQEPRTAYGFPVLFPPNRIADGRFTLAGREYRLPVNEPLRGNHLHGIPCVRCWEMGEVTASGLTMLWQYTPEDPCYRDYPFDCTLALNYTFLEKEMIQTLTIRNTGTRTMPCALGFHSAFTAPERAMVTGTGKRLAAPAENRFLPDGTEAEWPENFAPGKWFVPSEVTQYGHFRSGGEPLALLDHGGGLTVAYLPDPKFTWWILWRPAGDSSFLCAEPMNIPVNCHNSAPAELPLLAPGRSVCYRSSVQIRMEDDTDL